MSMTLLKQELNKQKFSCHGSTAEYTAVTFAARLCFKNIYTGSFTNEKIQQH